MELENPEFTKIFSSFLPFFIIGEYCKEGDLKSKTTTFSSVLFLLKLLREQQPVLLKYKIKRKMGVNYFCDI